MSISVEIPNDVVQHADPAREALEAVAIEGYRRGGWSLAQAGRLLNMTRFQFEGFLKDRRIEDHAYDVDDLSEDLETLRRLKARGLLGA